MIPTVGFNMRKITKGNVTIKVRAGRGRQWAERSPGAHAAEPGAEGSWGPGAQGTGSRGARERGAPGAGGKPAADAPPSLQLWDIGGQPRFRSMWERYCRGVSAIV